MQICHSAVHVHSSGIELVNAAALLLLFVLNLLLVGRQERLKRSEMVRRLKGIITQLSDYLSGCVDEVRWSLSLYPDLHTPSSTSWSLHWTYRDSQLVNLPVSLLVEGDIIALRPGQEAFASLRGIKDDEHIVLEPGDLFPPFSPPPSPRANEKRGPQNPQQHRLFRVVRTPVLDTVRNSLELALSRPITVLDNERFTVQSVITKIVCPVVLVAFLLVNTVRFFCDTPSLTPACFNFFQLQLMGVLPILPLLFPVMWVLVNAFGEARVLSEFSRVSPAGLVAFLLVNTVRFFCDTPSLTPACFNFFQLQLMGVLPILPLLFPVMWVLVNAFGEARVLSEFSRVSPAGLVLCCVDKQGILSWPNPSPETVLFFSGRVEPPHNSQDDLRDDLSVNSYCRVETDDDRDENFQGCPEAEADDFVCDYHLEMLSLSQDQQNPASIQFDDLSWQCHLPSLKPLGLNIMLNLCNVSVTQQLCRFSDHLSNLALQESNGTVLPVYVPWGLCELSRLIDNVQMLSHGSADLILESCTDFWDGTDIYPLSGSDRKKVLDFYQRACLSGYCSAFAYKPMQVSLSSQLNGKCVELAPGPCLFSGVELPSTTPIKHNSYRNSWSSDEGIGEGVEREDCVQALSGQIFMGMVSSQFQARLDTVRLIDALVTACIRFVYFSMDDELRSKVFAEKMGLETGWNCHISLTPNGDSPCNGAPSSPGHGSLRDDLNQDSRDEAEGPLLPEEEAHSDLASFQPTDSDVPSFLEDCNRARHTTYGIRKCFLFLLQCQLSLVIIQTQNYFLGCFLLKFGLTVCAYLVAFAFTLQEVCLRSTDIIFAADNTTVTCLHIFTASSSDEAPHWFSELSNGLLLTQKVMAGFLVLHTVVISLSYVHRSQPLWRKSPFSNIWWCLTVPVVLLSQIVQASVDYQLWRDRRSSLTFDLRDIPLLTWVLVSVSPLVVVVVNEVVKLHEIRYEANDSRD
ncbi:hypothetical protein F2P81_021861 [Scophthalmus maximus]|uniref:Transmembrane protein 94 n=1 Tax=Scophthalmus maximus TaxID=52904 RepID=A0A6A4S027_SCOMX|nr:hypothetical protein F2P81_021861 [Scophthalmus maximus]